MLPVLWRGAELADRLAALAHAARSQGVPVIAIQQTGPVDTPFDPHEPGWQLSSLLDLQTENVQAERQAAARCASHVTADERVPESLPVRPGRWTDSIRPATTG